MINGQPLGNASPNANNANDVSGCPTHVMQNRSRILSMCASGGGDVFVVPALT
jgi:hypothetical protein